MNKILILSLTTMNLLFLSGCGGSGGETELTNDNVIKQLEDNGTIPTLNRDNTLGGVDNDNNGIRDDIDSYISEHYTVLKERKAVQQSARALQKALLVDKNDIDKVREVDRADNRAVTCLFSVFDSDKIPNELEAR